MSTFKSLKHYTNPTYYLEDSFGHHFGDKQFPSSLANRWYSYRYLGCWNLGGAKDERVDIYKDIGLVANFTSRQLGKSV